MKLSEELTQVLCTYDDEDLYWYRHDHGYEFLEEYRLLSRNQCGDTSYEGVTPMEVIYQDEQLHRWKCCGTKYVLTVGDGTISWVICKKTQLAA